MDIDNYMQYTLAVIPEVVQSILDNADCTTTSRSEVDPQSQHNVNAVAHLTHCLQSFLLPATSTYWDLDEVARQPPALISLASTT